MSDFDRNVAARGGFADRTAAVDAGLRAYMLRVYNYMAAAVALTGVVAYATFNAATVADASGRLTLTPFGQTIYSGPLSIVLLLGTLGLVFFISAASFGALSLYGYTTQRDLSAMGSFLVMGLFGLILASLVNLIWPSGALSFAISVIGVGVFAGLTAYDTQRIKEMYDSMDDDGTMGRKAIMGALSLYLDFINLFLMLLRLVGDRR